MKRERERWREERTSFSSLWDVFTKDEGGPFIAFIYKASITYLE